jgi:hypothetical protein
MRRTTLAIHAGQLVREYASDTSFWQLDHACLPDDTYIRFGNGSWAYKAVALYSISEDSIPKTVKALLLLLD